MMKSCIDCSKEFPLSEYNKKRSDCKRCQSKRRALLENRFKECKRNARRRGYDFGLSFEKFDECTQQSCYLCGGFADNKSYNGIDRIDSNLGYLSINVRPCCWKCNNMKSDYSLEDFLSHIGKIYWYKIKTSFLRNKI